MEQRGFDARKNQKDRIAIWRSSATYRITRSKDLLNFIEIFSGKVQMPPPKLQVCLKHIVDRSTAEENKKMLQMLQDKKAKRLEQSRRSSRKPCTLLWKTRRK